MNLVAKEYVAAQNPSDPGVLILSQFAGAAKELDAALLVNPYDINGIARNISRALLMSADERRERWQAMIARLKSRPIQAWFSDFVDALTQVRTAPRHSTATVLRLPVPDSRGGRTAISR
jgi:trehalose 6-phosphate synthase